MNRSVFGGKRMCTRACGYLAQNTAQISRNALASGLCDDCSNRGQRFSGGYLFELSRDDARPTEIESPNDNCKARGYADRPLLTPDDSEAIRIPSETDPLPVRCTALPRSSRPEPERHRRFRKQRVRQVIRVPALIRSAQPTTQLMDRRLRD